MNEISLIIQSTCLEAAIGIILFLAVAKLWNKDLNGRLASILASVLAVLGVATSITHLGQPLRAFNSLLNLGSSWLSRETLGVALFTGCCVLCLILYLWKPAMKTVILALEWVSAAIGVVLLYIMGSIYTTTSVPVWQGANTYIEMFASAIILGTIIVFAATYGQQNAKGNKILWIVAFAALAVQVMGSELHTVALAASGSAAAVMSAAILNENIALVAAKWVLFAVGVGLFCLTPVAVGAPELVTVGGGSSGEVSAKSSSGGAMAWVAALSVFAAVAIGKVLFFEAMIVTGVGRV